MRSRFLDFAHVLFGKPVPTFPGHALAAATAMIGWLAASPVDAADFYAGKTIDFIIGATTMRAISRLVALLLAAIAINLIRRGWQGSV